MASDQNPGAKIFLYAKSPNGDERQLFAGVNEQTGPGGSPDGVQATVKANELPVMPVANFALKGGDRLLAKVKLVTADGIDASDCVLNIPIMRNGRLEFLSAADLGFTTDYPASTPAGVELPLGTGYPVPTGDNIMVGGSTYFMSVENDTA